MDNEDRGHDEEGDGVDNETEDVMTKQGNAKRMTKAIIHAPCGKI